jgi:hypothetical protein
VIPNSTKFQQPSKKVSTSINKKECIAGGSAGIGVNKIEEISTGIFQVLDYQVLNLTRTVNEPINQLFADEEQDVDVILEPPSAQLLKCTNTLWYQFKRDNQKFGKMGSTTQHTYGYLNNGSRQDCYVKVYILFFRIYYLFEIFN